MVQEHCWVPQIWNSFVWYPLLSYQNLSVSSNPQQPQTFLTNISGNVHFSSVFFLSIQAVVSGTLPSQSLIDELTPTIRIRGCQSVRTWCLVGILLSTHLRMPDQPLPSPLQWSPQTRSLLNSPPGPGLVYWLQPLLCHSWASLAVYPLSSVTKSDVVSWLMQA